MTTATGTTHDDTAAPNLFTGTDAVDTVRYNAAARAVYADLSTGSAYKLLRILPFGDSITYGVIGSTTDTESGGYRTLLQDRLALAEVVVDMVGSGQNGPARIDPDHEGHRGFTLNQLDTIDAGAIAAGSPDAILLMAGTNDSAKDTSTTMIADLRALIVSITKAAPDATVFVASIPPVRVGQQPQVRSDRVDAYNDKMPALIAELAASGRKIVFVDMRDLEVADISAPPIDSGLHPNARGYAKIADHWYDAMEVHLGLRTGAIGQDQDRFVSIENLEGSSFADRLTGDARTNLLGGLDGDDHLNGLAGDDVLTGGGGNDAIDGGDGTDTASFSGAWSDYAITIDAVGVRIADRRAGSPDGTDHIIATERFAFANGMFSVDSIANDAPVATYDTGLAKATAGMSALGATGNLLANDTDADIALGDLLRVTGVQSGVATATFAGTADTLTLDGSYGTLMVTIDGSYRYVVDAGRAAALGTGEGQDIFTYHIADASDGVASAMLAITIAPPDAAMPVPPSSTLYTRSGTQDGSAVSDDVLNGPVGVNSFYFDLAAASGHDRIERFETVDVLLTSAPLPGASNGRVPLADDGSITFDGSGDSVTIVAIDPAAGLRSLGTVDGLSVYAAGAVRPSGAIEGTVGADRMIGNTANTARQVYFFDTALKIGSGNDRIERFGRHDILVTTTALPDGNRDNIIDFGSDKTLNLPTGNLVVTSITNGALQKMEYDGTVERDGVQYYVYSLVGSAAGLGDLQPG